MTDKEKVLKDTLQTVKELREDIRFYKQVDVPRAYGRTVSGIRRNERKAWFLNVFNRAAAILFLPLLAGMFISIYLLSHHTGASVAEPYAEVKVSPGTVMQFELPDRSRVWLNSESRLRYPVQFKGEARRVELEGEGFFDVHTDAAMPFEVTAPSGLKVIARGTEFNLKAYGDDEVNEVVLQEGVVDVIYKDRQATIRPGDMVKLDKKNGQVARTAVQTDEKTAWKDGKIIFRNTPIEEVMKQLARRYNVNITLQNPKQKPYLVRATFSTETIPQILDYLKIAAPIEWKIMKTEQNEDSTFDRQQISVVIK
jgi:ferric-dicitrate binding protein FerR (iron transport regulator)